MNRLSSLMTLVGSIFLISCSSMMATDDTIADSTVFTSENMAEKIVLVPLQPVLVLNFKASDSGYELGYVHTQSVPTQSIFLDRDVLIEALDAEDKRVTAVSVFNPRDARSIGPSKDPLHVVLEQVKFTVALTQPQRIKTIRIVVRRGANVGLEATYPISTQTPGSVKR